MGAEQRWVWPAQSPLGPCDRVLVLNLFAARGRICGKWGRAALATSPGRTEGFLLPRAEIHPKYSSRGRHCCFSSLSYCKTCLDSSWGGAGALLATLSLRDGGMGCPSSLPFHPAGWSWGVQWGQEWGKEGHSHPTVSLARTGHRGTQNIVFPTGGEGDREQEPGEGEVSPSFLLPHGGYQELPCPARCAPTAGGVPGEPLMLGQRRGGSAQGGSGLKVWQESPR